MLRGSSFRTEEEANREKPYHQREVGGSRSSYVTVTTKDGDKQAVCAVNVSFRTVDNTVVHVEHVSLNQSEVKFMVEKLMTGSRTNPKVEYKVSQPQQLAATVTPEEAQNKKVGWSLADSSMAAISEEGLVTVKRDAKWIQDLEAADAANVAKNRYALSTASGTRDTIVTATTEDGQKTASCKVVVEFKTNARPPNPAVLLAAVGADLPAGEAHPAAHQRAVPMDRGKKTASGFRIPWGGGIKTRTVLIQNHAGSSFLIMA